jgi:hypothetical protein
MFRCPDRASAVSFKDGATMQVKDGNVSEDKRYLTSVGAIQAGAIVAVLRQMEARVVGIIDIERDRLRINTTLRGVPIANGSVPVERPLSGTRMTAPGRE